MANQTETRVLLLMPKTSADALLELLGRIADRSPMPGDVALSREIGSAIENEPIPVTEFPQAKSEKRITGGRSFEPPSIFAPKGRAT